MRCGAYVLTMVSVLALSASSAWAAGIGEKGKSGGGGGSSSSGGGSSGGGAAGGGSSQSVDRLEGTEGGTVERQKWHVEGNLEYHHLIRTSDLGGDAVYKNFFYWLGAVYWDPTEHDRFGIRGGVYQKWLADQGESGARLDDILVSYTRTIPIGKNFRLKPAVRTVIPLSYESQLQGLITAPRATLTAEATVGPFDFLLLGFVEGYIQRYKEAQGGNANPTWRLGALAEVDFTMPFHKPLSVGVDVYTASSWFYEPHGNLPSGGAVTTTTDPSYVNGQPLSQVYGGEVFVRYRLPEAWGISTDIQAAYADGDPVLGYQNALHDGVFRFNGFYRHVSEVYFALIAKY